MSVLYEIFLSDLAAFAKGILIIIFWNTVFYMNGGMWGSIRNVSPQEAKQYVIEWRNEVSSVTPKYIVLFEFELVNYEGYFYSSGDWGSDGDTTFVKYKVKQEDYQQELDQILQYCKIENRKEWNYFDSNEKKWWACVENAKYLGGRKIYRDQYDVWTVSERNEFYVRKFIWP